jgi:hypothetical protein
VGGIVTALKPGVCTENFTRHLQAASLFIGEGRQGTVAVFLFVGSSSPGSTIISTGM